MPANAARENVEQQNADSVPSLLSHPRVISGRDRVERPNHLERRRVGLQVYNHAFTDLEEEVPVGSLVVVQDEAGAQRDALAAAAVDQQVVCLLYTSDAADEL